MEELIKKAQEGGWKNGDKTECIFHKEHLLDPLFWQALGKACGWNGLSLDNMAEHKIGKIIEPNEWIDKAMEFHFINLTEGMDKGIEYLKSIVLK